jgi:DNA-binding GntR family transcriptional regulator
MNSNFQAPAILWMAKNKQIHLKTLREQVYDYLRLAMNRGDLVPGASVNLNEISEKLGISKTPLRFALLQLENEGFVTILARRGCVVKALTLEEIRNIYQIIGALESSVIRFNFDKITPAVTGKMRRFNQQAREALEEDDFSRYYDNNLKLHNCYLNLCRNELLIHSVTVLKNRLYDFPRKKWHIKEWEVNSTGEHADFIRLLEEGRDKEAADYIRDVHWSYEVQEEFAKQYYTEALENVKAAQ